MTYRLLAAAAAAVVVLQGCATPPPVVQAGEDLNVGIAKTCSFTPAQPVPGGSVSSTITMTNDGWCAYRATEKAGTPYLLGLVKQRPQNGELLIRKLGNETRVEYYPNPGFTGSDAFTVALRPQGGPPDATVVLTATVTPGSGVSAVRAAPEPEPEATTTRRTTTRRSTTPARKPTP